MDKEEFARDDVADSDEDSDLENYLPAYRRASRALPRPTSLSPLTPRARAPLSRLRPEPTRQLNGGRRQDVRDGDGRGARQFREG